MARYRGALTRHVGPQHVSARGYGLVEDGAVPAINSVAWWSGPNVRCPTALPRSWCARFSKTRWQPWLLGAGWPTPVCPRIAVVPADATVRPSTRTLMEHNPAPAALCHRRPGPTTAVRRRWSSHHGKHHNAYVVNLNNSRRAPSSSRWRLRRSCAPPVAASTTTPRRSGTHLLLELHEAERRWRADRCTGGGHQRSGSRSVAFKSVPGLGRGQFRLHLDLAGEEGRRLVDIVNTGAAGT